MGRISIELIRKRSEHNEGEIQSLEELALHQEKLEKIENLDKWCRGLRVLLLQNNNISKIENLSRLKCLEYLNLALNNIEVIEGLEGCESLKKLDLTLNFVGQISSVTSLRQNHFLEHLYLTGNPCTDFSNCRNYVVSILPKLKVLDGVEIVKSERITAKQAVLNIEKSILSFEQCHKEKRELERKMPLDQNIGDDDFWTRTTANTPETRSQIQKRLEWDEEIKSTKNPSQKQEVKVRKYFTEDGRPLNINEAKLSFSLHDDYENGTIVVEIGLPKFLETGLVNADVQTNYVRVLVKKKIFQLCLPEEVRPDSSLAQRSRTSGHLVITMPKLDQDKVIEIWRNSKTTHSQGLHQVDQKEKKIIYDLKNDFQAGDRKLPKPTSSRDFNEEDVPPLV